MISVGSSDGRKRSGLGLEMEETELEEGEAPSYHDEAEDSTIDPDIDLSYIEEKLQNVLGHFQKDFEGGVSAENLGAKFGGYGSFLPTYQRSPSWPHTRSPAQVQNYDLPRSPRKLHLEDQRQYSFASTSASPSARSRDTSGKDVPVGNSLKGKGYLQSKHAEESSLKRGAIKNPSDQRTLKVRIKVGSENLSTQKNAEIYSGLGLVVSPSSSLDESPTTSVGLCGKLLSVPEESPTSILQIMTSYPGELLLSPLPDDLVYLTEKRKPRGKCENERMDKTSIESSGLSVNGSHSRSNQKVKEPKKLKSRGKYGTFSMELTNQKNSGDNNNTVSLIKKNKEDDIDTSRCEELVSNALKLPLFLSSQHGVADPAKDVPTAATVPLNALEDAVKGEILPASMEKEHLDSESAHKIGRFEKLGGSLGSSGKDSGSKKANIVSNIAAAEKSHTVDCSESNVTKGRRDFIAAAPEGEKSRALDHSESHASKGRKALTAAEPTEPTKQFLKGGYFSEEGLKPDLEKLSTGGKRKQKLSQGISTQGLYVEKDELMVESSLTHKVGKNSHINDLLPKTDPYDLQKDREKPGDRYKDFFGDLEFDDEDNESISGEMIPSEWLKDPQFIVKRSLSEDRSTPKDKWNSKSSEKPLPPETHPSLASHLAPPLGNGPSSEAPTGLAPLVNEDWVLCDKCQKWRLLPLGTNPKSLPDKWICRMLNWLPGMNRCSIPEEETTSALRALYHPAALVPAPASESQCVGVNTAAVNSVDAKYPNPDHRSIAVQTATINGKKKHGSTKATNSTELDGSTHSSNSRKKNLVASGKISNLNSEVHPPSLEACGYQQLQQSSAAVEKYNDVEEEKISLVKCSGKDANLKIKSKREAGVEGSRAYKRKKTEDSHFEDENWTSDNGGTSSKVGRGSTSLSNNTSGNDLRKYINNKDLSGEAKKNAVSGIVAEKHVSGTLDGLLSSGKCDKDSVRKRKVKKPHGSQIRTEPTLSSVRHPDCSDFVEEKCESDHWKEKKARVSKSGGKDTSGSKTSVGTDRKSKDTKDLHNKQFVRNKQAAVYIKSDMGTEQPLVAANSSSSKVSGLHENKTSGQEIKGSPVESVSSSPFKSTNADNVISTRTNLNEKDDFHDYGFVTAVSPRRLSCGEDGGGDRTEMVKKDRILSDRIEMVQKERILNINGPVTADGNNDQLCQINQYGSVKHSSDKSTVEEKTIASESQNSDFHVKKSAKVLSFLSKDKAHATGSHLDKVNIKVSDSSHDSFDRVHLYEEKLKSRRSKSDEKSGNPCKGEKFICKKDTAGGTSSENSRGQIQKKFVHDGQDAGKSRDKKHNIQQDSNNEKLPKKGNPAEAYGSGKSNSLPPLARVQTETVATPQPVSGSHTDTDVKTMAIDPFDDGDALRVPNRRKRMENPSGQPARNPIPNSSKVRDVEASSPLRRDSSSQAANNALKEAKDLKHLADRHKNSGSADSIRFYFEAVLKFLHAASLLESGNNEPTKHNELMHSMHIYSSTAKLCEFCAHEYEKSKDMAAAALAYKCVEVAYMRVVYSSHTSASRDWNELQRALQIVPSGESPSSSASDVDNLNHQATTDKVALAKVVSSPQVSGGHVITSRNRSGFLRILNFAQDVNFAMEASRKSRIAFTAATSGLGETSLEEGISSLKKALDFNFQDVESLLHLVRVAMEAINR